MLIQSKNSVSQRPGLAVSDASGLILPSDYQWLENQIASLTEEQIILLPSEWAELKRSIPPELTRRPGPWSNDYIPFMVEIMNRFHERDPARKIAVMKAVQIGATTAILENVIGYTMDHAPCGMMYVSADKELVEMSIDVKLDRMLESCGLQGKLKAATAGSRKTGNTSDRKEFPGGFLLAVGARNPGKLRSMACKLLLMDELDGMPLVLGSEGSPLKLAENRTSSFEATRKILYISTPLVTQTSLILQMFNRGDQRYYNVPCKLCGEFQVLKWSQVMPDGEIVGVTFDVGSTGRLIPDSVGYRCEHCREVMKEYDKAWFLPRGEWKSTAEPEEEHFYSYHINGMMSPLGMRSWKTLVYDWLEAWNVKLNRCRDQGKLKVFYNTGLGKTFEERGEAPKWERIIQHRRPSYSRNQIPNQLAIQETGGPIQVITVAADVHKDRIDVEIVGWADDYVSYLIDFREITGDTGTIATRDSAYHAVKKIIEQETWIDFEGREYSPQIMLLDARYNTDAVYQFAKQFKHGVYPIQGLQTKVRSAKLVEFSAYVNKQGGQSYNINTTHYKDKFFSWLRSDWDQGTLQPPGRPNYPVDFGDSYFRHYEAETKMVEKNRTTKQIIGFNWVKADGKDNHALDTRVYNMAAIDLFILSAKFEATGKEIIDSTWFWKAVKDDPFYWKAS